MNKVTFNIDDVDEMRSQAASLREKAKRLVAVGNHAHAADCIEIANCADVIRNMVMHMTHLLSKCPCCYEKPTMN
jgi:hypothetical protein